DFNTGSVSHELLLDAASPAAAIQWASLDSCWVVTQDPDNNARLLLKLHASGAVLDQGAAGSGGADRLASGPDGRMYIWDRQDRTATMLRLMPETEIWEPYGRRMGVWISTSLDSTSIETV